MKALFVEDEKLLADALKHLFETNAIEADVAYDGSTGNILALNGGYDILILDIMLPGDYDGLDILRHVRDSGSNVPVLMLTAKDSLKDKVTGLNLGADDYLVKPFESDELLARVHALIRRHSAENRSTLMPRLKLDKETSEMILGDERVRLTGKEMSLLELLLKNQGHPKSKEAIIEEIWGRESGVTENSVELYIHYLRKKLKGSDIKIKTIRNQGYLLSG